MARPVEVLDLLPAERIELERRVQASTATSSTACEHALSCYVIKTSASATSPSASPSASPVSTAGPSASMPKASSACATSPDEGGNPRFPPP